MVDWARLLVLCISRGAGKFCRRYLWIIFCAAAGRLDAFPEPTLLFVGRRLIGLVRNSHCWNCGVGEIRIWKPKQGGQEFTGLSCCRWCTCDIDYTNRSSCEGAVLGGWKGAIDDKSLCFLM